MSGCLVRPRRDSAKTFSLPDLFSLPPAFGTFQTAGESNPYIIFEHAVRRLVETFPKLAYIHFGESFLNLADARNNFLLTRPAMFPFHSRASRVGARGSQHRQP